MSVHDLLPFHWSKKRNDEGERPFFALQRQMNHLFDDFFSGFGAHPFRAFEEIRAGFSPKVRVRDEASAMTVEVELPGMDEKDIELSLTKDLLIIRGEKRQEQNQQREGATTYSEVSYGRFERQVPLSFEVEEDKVEATYKKGVLSIVLPRTASAQKGSKKISIRAA